MGEMDQPIGMISEAFPSIVATTNPRATPKSVARRKAAILAWADHERRPNAGAESPKERRLGRALTRYISPSCTSYDPDFLGQLERERPLWFQDTGVEGKTAILAWPNHERRPNGRAEDTEERRLSRVLQSYISPSSPRYDPAFREQLKRERPLWFQSTAAGKKAAILNWPHERRPSRSADDPKERRLAQALSHYTSRSSASYDAAFHALLKREHPKWFINQSLKKKNRNAGKVTKNKAAILAWPDHEKKPNKEAEDPEERRLGGVLSKYISPSSVCYDPEFWELLERERPLWFRKQRKYLDGERAN